MSQAELAEAAGISTKYLGTVERGEQSPTLNVLRRLAAGLDVDLRVLVDVEDEIDAKLLRAELLEMVRGASDDDLRRLVQLAKIAIRPAKPTRSGQH